MSRRGAPHSAEQTRRPAQLRVARHSAKSTTFPSISGWVCSSTRRPSTTSGMAMASSQYRAKGFSRQFEELASAIGEVGPGGSATAPGARGVLRSGGARILGACTAAGTVSCALGVRPEEDAPRHPRRIVAILTEHNNDALVVVIARVDPRAVRARVLCAALSPSRGTTANIVSLFRPSRLWSENFESCRARSKTSGHW